MANTKLEKIKAFNASQSQKTQETQETIDDKDKTTQQQIKQKADQKQMTAEEIAAEKLRIAEEEKQAQIDTIQQLTDATASIVDRVNAQVNPLKTWISSQPTPGGIAALLLFIAFMAFVTIPVDNSGHTRAYLFWQTLMGRTHLKYRESTPIGGQASGNFGSGGPGINTSPQNGYSSGLAPVDITHLNLFPGFNP